MERVLGIGGFFFESEQPERLARWYAEHLGVIGPGESYDDPVWCQEPGETVFAPFGPEHRDSPHLGPAGWGINFRVSDLDAMVAQLRQSGLAVAVDRERYPNGRFARLHDIDGNPVQLWQHMTPRTEVAVPGADTVLDTLLALEHAVWRALVEGAPDVDERLLAADFLGVYPTGFADRATHVGKLADGPTVADYELEQARIVAIGDDAALLVYRATYRRRAGGAPEEMYVSSLWCRREDGWVNTFSQDTPVGDAVV